MMHYNPGNLGIGANPINFNNTLTQPLVQPPQATTNFQASIGNIPNIATNSLANPNALLTNAQIHAAQNIQNTVVTSAPQPSMPPPPPQPPLTQIVTDSKSTIFTAIPGPQPLPVATNNAPTPSIQTINIPGTQPGIDMNNIAMPNAQTFEMPKPDIGASAVQDSGLIIAATNFASKAGAINNQSTNVAAVIEQPNAPVSPIEPSSMKKPTTDKPIDKPNVPMPIASSSPPNKLGNIAQSCQDGVRGFTYIASTFPNIAPLNFDDEFSNNQPVFAPIPAPVTIPIGEFWKNPSNVISSYSETHHRVANAFLDHIQSNIGREFTPVEKTALHKQMRIVRSPANDYVVTLRGGRLNLSNNYIVISGGQKFNSITAQFGGMYDFELAPRARANLNQDTSGTMGEFIFRILRPATTFAGRVGTGLAWLLTPSEIGLDSNEFTAQDVDLEVPVYHAHNEPPFRSENIPVRIDPRNDRMETPAQPRNKHDNVVSGFNSQPAVMDRRPLTTPAHDERTREDVLMFREMPRYNCSNGLAYRGAGYHTVKGNLQKSKEPSDPIYALENSIKVKETSNTRISYNPGNKEIVILMETIPGEYHGHVQTWKELETEHKNILIEKLGFKPNGKYPKNTGS